MKTINYIEEILNITNEQSIYQLKATKGRYNRVYQFKDYEILRKTYTYLQDNGWNLEIKMF